MIVDVPCSSGSGTSNDGNSARLFFKEYEKSAKITGVNVDLIKHFSIILTTINSGFDIEPDKFDTFCKTTASIYVKHYNWFFMPRSVHQILMHGSKIIEHFSVPIGMLSEEAQEACNKDYKFTGTFHTRKMSKIACNEDLFHLLLAALDPYISFLRKKSKHCSSSTLSKDVLALLKVPSGEY